ncbi:MAG: GNAT family N-acetyltransferase [Candidatus Izemoplasmatales bacterium]
MELRSCRPEERLDAIRLSRSVFKDNMAEQFATLFAPENVERMLVAVDGGKVVSMVNYYPGPVRIGPATIRVASIGSVCTDPAYRGQGLAANLLRLAEAKMLAEGIHVVVISGGGGIYSAFGSEQAGDMREATVPTAHLASVPGVSIRPYAPSDFNALRRLHAQDPVRFVRRAREFRQLLEGQTYPDTYADYPVRLVERDGAAVAYAILVIDKGNDEVGIKEMGGDRAALVAAFPLFLAEFERVRIHFAAAPDDPVLGVAEEKKPIHQFASLKIVDFPGCMKALRPFFRSVLGKTADELRFTAPEGVATIFGGGSSLRVTDPKELAKIVFGCAGSYHSGADGWLGETLSRIFPVPFPWTHSINYQ